MIRPAELISGAELAVVKGLSVKAPRSRAFTILEMMITLGILGLLSALLLASLLQTSRMWRRNAGRDEALRQIGRARSSLSRDLLNSTSRSGLYATSKVAASLGSGNDGDALSFLSSDPGSSNAQWSLDPNTGAAFLPQQVTYWLVIPNGPNPEGLNASAGPPDARGYEQQYPDKWLMRRVDPAPSPPSLDSSWTTWLVRPTVLDSKVVATRLLNFRVLQAGPVWSLELRATSILDARRNLALGSVPLAESVYTVTQQFSLTVHN